MNLLFHLHTYCPHHTSGADIYAERIATYLGDKTTVKVIVDKCSQLYTYKNHTVESNSFRIAENYEWSDAIITNLVTRNQAVWLAERFKKPVFHIVHNATIPTLQAKPDNYIIYNSFWLKQARPLNFDSIVVQPVTWGKDWKRSTNGKYITLINLTFNKGAQTFYALAKSLPQYQFLGIHGGYGQQFRQPLKNITYAPFTTDMQNVYDATRLLIVPSKQESWSLCAAEAQCCGIPVVCSDLPGLRENLGNSAIYANTVREYMDAIASPHNIEAGYARQAQREKNHIEQLNNLFNFIEMKVKKDDTASEKVLCESEATKEKKELDKKVAEKKIINRRVNKTTVTKEENRDIDTNNIVQ